MAILRFTKWQGTGNDFIVVDDRAGACPPPESGWVQRLCDRHYGIGSDGLILVQAPRGEGEDFHMDFLNPDGSRSFCGNGSRCAVAFYARLIGAGSGRSFIFSAIDGVHEAWSEQDRVVIGMRDVATPISVDDQVELLDTGSPHLVCWVDDPEQVDLVGEGRALRNDPRFAPGGVNVNFVRWRDGRLVMRTYERGVEDETLSCGTGVTAAALSAMHRGLVKGTCAVSTRGGALEVSACPSGSGFIQVRLAGSARPVFEGMITVEP